MENYNYSEAGTLHKTRFCLVVTFIVLVMSCWGCTHSSTLPAVGTEVGFDSTTFEGDKEQYPAKNDLFDLYRISPGDMLDVFFQVNTWKVINEFKLSVDDQLNIQFPYAPELNQLQLIQPDGYIFLPMVGEVRAAGKTVMELTAELEQKYKPYLKDPDLLVTVPEFRANIKQIKQDLSTAPRGLSRLVTVRPDGYCTFPLVGELLVAGRTVPDVNQNLDNMYDEYLQGLKVNLFLHETSGTRVYVLGEVNNSGAYAIQRPSTVMESLTLAGGYTRQAELEKVVVFRRKGKKYIGTRIDMSAQLHLEKGGSFFYLMPDDIVYVPRKGRSELAEVMRDVADILMFDGWSIGFGWDISDTPVIGDDNIQ